MATNLVTQITKLAQRAAMEDKAVRALAVATDGKIGDITTLNTTTKTSVVAALNSLKTAIDAIEPSNVTGATINDTMIATDTDSDKNTWSIAMISAQIKTAIDQLVGGAPAALDTLNELATKLASDESIATALATTVAAKANAADVYAKTETFTKTEVNSAIADATATLATAASVTTVATAAATAQSDVDALEAAIGLVDTSDNYFADLFAAALINAG